MQEQQNDTGDKKFKNTYISICTTQAVCIAVILAALLLIKLFSNKTYKKTEQLYNTYIADDVDVSNVFDEDYTREI